FNGTATVTLLHLPKGVTLTGPAPQITPSDNRVVFHVSASLDALLGLYRDIACEVTLAENGQLIKQNTGSGVLRVDPAKTELSQSAVVTPAPLGPAPVPAHVRLRDAEPRPVSFRLDVMPVFFRAGCNGGACHGAALGKDGFHLSLFGYDPAGDYYRLTQQVVGRRIDNAVPKESLLLLKATGMVPHTGGPRAQP